MKKAILQAAFFSFLMFGISMATHAKDQANSYRIGATAGWINYLEPGYISFYGMMYGFDAMAQLNNGSSFDLRIETSFQYGNIQYDGSVKDTATGAVAPLKAGAYDYLYFAKVKPEFVVGSAGTSDFFVNAGIGLRYVNDRVNSFSGYQREISYVFLPIGFRCETNFSEKKVFVFDLEYDFFVLGKVKSHLSDTNSSNPDVTNTQSTGSGYRILLEYRFLAGERWYAIKPYYQWWSIDASDSAPFTAGFILIEPRNSTGLAGISFDVGF